MLGAGLLLAAVLVGLGLRAVVNNEGGAEDETAVSGAHDEGGNDQAEGSDDEQSNSDSEGTTSSTAASAESTSTTVDWEPTFVELSGLTMTRTGECQSLTVAVDSIITVASGGQLDHLQLLQRRHPDPGNSGGTIEPRDRSGGHGSGRRRLDRFGLFTGTPDRRGVLGEPFVAG